MRFWVATAFLLNLGLVGLSRAAEIPHCVPGLPVGTLCKEKISSLRPTQPDVGRYEVAIKTKKYSEMTEKEFEKLQLRKPAPVVVGPDGKFYLLDHHHTALAMSDSGHTHMYLKIEKDWSKTGGDLPMRSRLREFWNKMESAKPPLGYFRDESGKLINPLSKFFPRRLKNTGNNRYRSLVYLLIDEKVIDINDVKYAEFYIGETLRELGVKIEGNDFGKAVDDAKKVLATPEALKAIEALTEKGCGVMRALKLVILPAR